MENSRASYEQRKQAAQILFERRQFDAALLQYQKLSATQPDDPDNWHVLSAIYGMKGNLTGAESCCRRVIELLPSFPGAYLNLGNALSHLGRLDEAQQVLRSAIKQCPADARLHLLLGKILEEAGNLHAAASSYQTSLNIDPDLVDACIALGTLLPQLGSHDKAIEHLEHAVTLTPDNAELYNLLGNTYHERGRLDDALTSFNRAIELQPDFTSAHYNKGIVYELRGMYEEAIEEFSRVHTLDPDDVKSIAGQVNVLNRSGNFDKAQELIQPYLNAPEVDPIIANAFARLCRHTGTCTEAIALLRNLIEHTPLQRTPETNLRFTLGGLLDQAGDYDAAFRQFERANTLKGTRYNPAKDSQYVDTLLDIFSPARYSGYPKASTKSRKPVFIVGMPRSGTTLTEQILSSHHEVHGGGELGTLGKTVAELSAHSPGNQPFPLCMEHYESSVADELAQNHLAELEKLSSTAARITNKMPHNFLYIGLIFRLFPDATIIHCKRDSMDTCLSCYFQNFSGHHNYAYDLEHLGKHYLLYERVMDHWKNTLRIPMFELPYESLVKDPEIWTHKLVEYCRLAWDPDCLRFSESGRKAITASYDQVRQPIYTHSISRWRNYEHHLDPLKRALNLHV